MWVRPTACASGSSVLPWAWSAYLEARPNVTADAIGLCIKSGNAVILRVEAIDSNIAIVG